MSAVTELLHAIFGTHSKNSDDRLLSLLEAALEAETEPLAYLCHHHVDAGLAYERIATHLGLAFSDRVPRDVELTFKPGALDDLAHLRLIDTSLWGRYVRFFSPSLQQCLTLARHVESFPDARHHLCIVPPGAMEQAKLALFGKDLLASTRERLARRWPFAAAHLELPIDYRASFVALVATIVLGTILAPFWLQPLLLPLMAGLLLVPAVFRIVAARTQNTDPPEIGPLLEDAALPDYSILIPLRDEAHMVPDLARTLRALDYPPEKLDIKFIVEADSPPTIEAVRRELWSTQFSLVVPPHASPQTKPKALNYALPLVRGMHVVVYDAEDAPEPLQPRKAATLFARHDDLHCLQAELVIDNASENWLTTSFATEYAGLFGVMLPALAKWGFPVPLGGTSNHFRTATLRALGGWDSFNVTEDADLGMRLARAGMKTAMLSSQTLEEAPSDIPTWLKQRTRWMKGWMQTYLVHAGRRRMLIDALGWRGFAAFHILIGSQIISPLLHTAFFASVVIGMLIQPHNVLSVAGIVGVLQVGILIGGYSGAVLLAREGLMRLHRRDLMRFLILLPIYWLLIGLATLLAARELLFKPHFWAKTRHQPRRGSEKQPARPQKAVPARDANRR